MSVVKCVVDLKHALFNNDPKLLKRYKLMS